MPLEFKKKSAEWIILKFCRIFYKIWRLADSTTFCCEIQLAWWGSKKKPNALKRAIKGPAKNPLQLTRKRPVRCVDTISPDTFHLML